jgi:hypothetical protein
MELVMILLVLTLILIINTLSFRSYLFLLRYLGVNVHPHEYYAKLLLVNLDNHAQAPPQKPSAIFLFMYLLGVAQKLSHLIL